MIINPVTYGDHIANIQEVCGSGAAYTIESGGYRYTVHPTRHGTYDVMKYYHDWAIPDSRCMGRVSTPDDVLDLIHRS